MSPIKEKLISFIQKIIVIFLAGLMFMTMLPVGLFPGSDTPSAEGEFTRLLPAREQITYDEDSSSTTRLIGKNHSVIYSFDISSLSKISADEINQVKLRLAFLTGSGTTNNIVYIKTFKDSQTPSEHPFGLSGGTTFAVIRPYTTGTDDSLSEIDMTDYAKQILASGRTEISIGICSNSEICLTLASQNYDDEAYRPCLKTVTGIAKDTDATTLKKAELSDLAYVSKDNENSSGGHLLSSTDSLYAGNGNETYLKFNINKDAMLGSLYSAKLRLVTQNISENTRLHIYCINNNQWNTNEISYSNRPRGEEAEAISFVTSGTDTIIADITQQICEAVNNGIYTITIRITADGTDTVRFFAGRNSKTTPKLYLKCSDNPDIVCVSEAALNALGDNRRSFVTMDLPNSYSAQNGKYAKINWSGETSAKTQYVSSDGEISRPKWFEGNAETTLFATIHSGDYSSKRRFVISIPAESAPNYSNYSFTDYINIGNSQSENEHKFEYTNMSATRRRWVDGKQFIYRVAQPDCKMILNFSCSPYDINYLTLKFWEGEGLTPADISVSAHGVSADPITISVPESTQTPDDGFLYATYALPKEFTNGKRNVSLRLSTDNAENGVAIYSAYLTQSPFFEPMQFEKQGEKLISEPYFSEGAIKKFLDNLGSFFAGTDSAEIVEQSDEKEILHIDESANSLIFAGNDTNIAFNPNLGKNTVSVYQRTDYYNRYCADCPLSFEKDIVTVNYGSYVLIWNKSTDSIPVSATGVDFSGVYRNIVNDEYYIFTKDSQMTDDSVIPEDKTIVSGYDLSVGPLSAVLLTQVSDSMQSSDWRVRTINGKSVSELTFSDAEKIDSISVKAVGGVSQNSDTLTVICQIYEDDKLAAIHKTDTDVTEHVDVYNIDLSDSHLYMKKNRSIKVFIADNTEELNTILPKLEFPQ